MMEKFVFYIKPKPVSLLVLVAVASPHERGCSRCAAQGAHTSLGGQMNLKVQN